MADNLPFGPQPILPQAPMGSGPFRRHATIPVFLPEIACPHRCVFCNQYRISGATSAPDLAGMLHTMELHLSTMQQGTRVEVGFFGGNFTAMPTEVQEKYLAAAMPFISQGRIHGIRLSTRPDAISDSALDLLARYGVDTIELGVQSLDDGVLALSGRGHNAACTLAAAKKVLERGFRLGMQMMIGLPGDTPEKALNTAKQIVLAGAAETRIYPVVVVRNTLLAQWYQQGTYIPLSIQQAVAQTAPLVQLFSQAGIKILRLGLHPSPDLLSGEGMLAGPFHPSFGALVHSHIWHEMLSSLPQDFPAGAEIRLTVPKGRVNAACGHQGANRKMLLQHFKKVHLAENSHLSEFGFHVDIC